MIGSIDVALIRKVARAHTRADMFNEFRDMLIRCGERAVRESPTRCHARTFELIGEEMQRLAVSVQREINEAKAIGEEATAGSAPRSTSP